MRVWALLFGLLFAQPLFAQETTELPSRSNKSVAISQTAMLRVIDRVAGRSETITAEAGISIQVFDSVLFTVLVECRYYEDNPSGEAFAFLEVMDASQAKRVFYGWMIASSPALHALEHNRYDIWPLRCITS